MPYQHIAYVSHASKSLSSGDIDALLLNAREFNLEHNVTGILLFDKTKFFQFFEGQPESVEKVFDRIKKSTKNNSVIELANRHTDVRYFEKWSMGFSYAPKSELQAIAQSDWLKKKPILEKYANECIGLALLLAFCADNFASML